MDNEINRNENIEYENDVPEVRYNAEKDFYRGLSGELRFKAEGLFKKAKEKGISIDDIEISVLRERRVDFPGIGEVELPAYVVKVKGRNLQSGQIMVDAKQIDYFNRYQKYLAEGVERKNAIRDERGKALRERGKVKLKEDSEFTLSDKEKFEVGKSIVDDKEYGLEKTITGGCDRVIRKLMGENDWLYPGEAKLLDEEFAHVQKRIANEQENQKSAAGTPVKKATDRQINFMKAKIKNWGFDPDDNDVIKEVLKQAGYERKDVNELSTSDMSRIIDGMNIILPRVKDAIEGDSRDGTVKS